MEVTTELKIFITDQMLEDALIASLKAQALVTVDNIKDNIKSMGIYESGREHDSIQAVMSDWETPLGSMAESSDRLDRPSNKHDVNIGSAVPYAAVNELGDGVKPPRPAFRQAAKLDNTEIATAYNKELRAKGLK